MPRILRDERKERLGAKEEEREEGREGWERRVREGKGGTWRRNGNNGRKGKGIGCRGGKEREVVGIQGKRKLGKEEKLEKSGNGGAGEGSSQAGRRKNKEERGKKG